MKLTKHITMTIFILVGVALLLNASYRLYNSFNLHSNGIKTTGVVVGHTSDKVWFQRNTSTKRKPETKIVETPLVEFDVYGIKHTTKNVSREHLLGDKLEIIYLANKPSSAVENTSKQLWFNGIVSLIIGLAFLFTSASKQGLI